MRTARRLANDLDDGGAAQRLGRTARRLAPWETVRVVSDAGSPHVTATPTRHGPAGIEALAGDVIGFLIGTASGDAIYVTGDTIWFDDVAELRGGVSPGLSSSSPGSQNVRRDASDNGCE